jgi:uncharacterized coiled-coil DUF342 family protein
MDVETLAGQVNQALDEAEQQINALRTERSKINAELKQLLVEVHRLERLRKAVTPRRHDGDGE